MKNDIKEKILNSYQATFALSKTSKNQIYMAMEEYDKMKDYYKKEAEKPNVIY